MPMGLADRAVQELLDSDEESPFAERPSANRHGEQREVVDLTGSSPPLNAPPHPPPQESRTSSTNSRRYVVPHWQPDSEVSECPICWRPFTWLFRRHHCRKCGRVVCNECSPHRITIPRQYIVNPPSPEESASPTATEGYRVETIDLTGDDEDGDGRFARRHLEGGEKVRLCNPCVPDPQPDPLPNLPSTENLDPDPRPTGSLTSMFQGPRRPSHTGPVRPPNRHRTGTLPTLSPMPTANTPTFGSFTGRPRPSSMVGPSAMFPPGYDPRFGPHNNPLPPLPSGSSHSSMYGHGRYASLDSRNRIAPEPYRRSRGNSMFDQHLRDLGTTPPAPRHTRPRLNEADICPICRRALPPAGLDGDESEREAHIINCISARDHSSGEGSSSRPNAVHMISFVASEKDCLGGDGNAQECSICMVEYDPGDELARLECFCKFHKECIVSWLNRKAECPVHKASNMHF